ncbi:MAG: hypothetical protein P8H43_01025 [Crocinitomicaceae bacterium]|nr:hypothetical protein [Crocinitomicaceae bacterium]
MSKFSRRGVRLKYTNKLCLNDRQGLFLVQNNERVLLHKTIQGWIDEDPELIYNHVYRSVAFKIKRLGLSKKALNYLRLGLKDSNPKINFNIDFKWVMRNG